MQNPATPTVQRLVKEINKSIQKWSPSATECILAITDGCGGGIWKAISNLIKIPKVFASLI